MADTGGNEDKPLFPKDRNVMVGNSKGMVVKMKRSQAPKDAFLMSSHEVANYTKERMDNWEQKSDTKWFSYGKILNFASTNITGLCILSHFRKKFLLTHFGYAFGVGMVVVLPSCFTVVVSAMNEQQVLMGSSCPTCMEVRSGVYQVLTSVAYCCLTAPVTSIYTSKRYHTYLMAKNNFQPNVMHALKMKPSSVYSGLLLVALNFAVGYFVTHKQEQEIEKVIVQEAITQGQAFIDGLPEEDK